MAEGESRIPAWRRLGLALKKETQSGVTAPEPSTSHADVQQIAPYDARNGSHEELHSSSEPAINGKSSNLGKRKHQHDTAEEPETQKKSKASTPEISQTGTPKHEESTVPQADSATGHPNESTEAAPGAGETKGDPNYRKKKSKPSKSRRRDNGNNPNHTEVAQSRSALSPDTAAPAQARQTLLASTEKEGNLAAAVTPQQPSTTRKANIKDSSGSPSAVDRRKSVAFTPDTKSVDGSSAQDYFKKWTAEQKGSDVDYFASDVAEFYRNAVNEGELRDAKKDEDRKEQDRKAKEQAKAPEVVQSKPRADEVPTPATKAVAATSTSPTSKSKKKDPSYYVSYLQQYYADRDHWKFNKAKQNDVIDNALNIFRIPDEHSDALLEYVSGLKGAGVIDRLRKKCNTTLKELQKEEASAEEMDGDARKSMHDEALQERIVKEQKRRKVEGDVEGLLEHPHSDGYIRRMRRKRAEALLLALGRTAPILPAVQTNGINPLVSNLAPGRDSKKRKRRVDISSSESSSDSSEDSSSDEDSSSSESDSDDNSEQSDSDSSDSDSDSGSDSDSDPSGSGASAPSRKKRKNSGASDASESSSKNEQSESDDSD
ncbi:hypothetical protein FB567DRAFT_175627 [Paraphoma chrysanthemicola]|uniref:WKF domain-containing protein n=1 Tax=Paraphoma chrysanthemicola TaxID=798071 RepID=A0A8K0RIM1_9PLEO|nr:hypothetical protein FB567DRAFT_175627 [Paraphoma chrysanthemicola]